MRLDQMRLKLHYMKKNVTQIIDVRFLKQKVVQLKEKYQKKILKIAALYEKKDLDKVKEVLGEYKVTGRD